MAQPPDVLLPVDPAIELLANGVDPLHAVERFPASSAAWAALAQLARHRGEQVGAYAFARVGYHRGLDVLRRSGWKGHGPIPWEHEPNRGFLTCLYELALAAHAIGEAGEDERCVQFIRDSSSTAPIPELD